MNRSTLPLLPIALLLAVSLGCQDDPQPTPRIVEGERTDALGMPLEITISDIPPIPPEIMGPAVPSGAVERPPGPKEGDTEAGPLYDLPLVIDVADPPELPEVPPEIVGPSEPQEDPAAWRRVWRD